MNEPNELLFDLTPIGGDVKGPLDLRWETLRGKRNRIAVGTPLCAEEPRPDQSNLADSHSLRAYDRTRFDFYRLALSLTLLPDHGCRFVDAQLTLMFEDHFMDAPLFLTLLPSETTFTRTLTMKEEASKGISLGTEPATGDLKHTRSRSEEVQRVDVQVASFGARTPEAGWIFRLTNSRELPIDTNLEALAVLPKGTSAPVRLKVAAQIAIEQAFDRILTSFLGTPQPGGEATIVVGRR